ncbi:CHAT domain-containing protein [Argonema galeatum]|uniref:CHAT domain-containing protein n=1 Tax=Argonema galeatum TaxID=2942762 RepID=UPI0020112B60|nr:CHAT domain-containing tetratricopeptide repeat protein [Argonema galeatum]MCL1464014.1 CHAT domain-containing protein [Argonema galeatum A003/A1]
MKRIISGVLALGVCLTPLTLPLMVRPSWGQSENLQQELQRLLRQATQQTQQGQLLQSIATFQQALAIARQLKDKEIQGAALLGIGFNYNKIGRKQEALDFYNQALAIFGEMDRRLWEATTLNSIGIVYRDIGQPQEALKYYNLALVIRREVNDRAGEATTLNSIGIVYGDIGQPQEALKYYHLALVIRREVNDRAGEATTLNSIGTVYGNIGQPQEALKYYNLALVIRREVNDRSGEAVTLNNIGSVYDDIGQPQEALKYFNLALPIMREVNNRSGEAATLNNIGAVYQDIGQTQEALKYFNLALPIMREVNDRSGEAATLNNIGSVYDDIGQPQEGLKYYNLALPIRREVNDRAGEATTLNNIGFVYQGIGQPQEALKYYNLVLPIRREVNDRSGEAVTLNNIGFVYQGIGQPQEALKYYNLALPIMREVNNRTGEAGTLNNIGLVYRDIGQSLEALKYYNLALPIMREVNYRVGEAGTLNNIGFVYQGIGQPQKALKYFNLALPIIREVNYRVGEVTTLGNIGLLYRDTNKPIQAIFKLEESIAIALEMRKGLQKENRQNFLDSDRPKGTSIALISLLIDQNQPDRAFRWANLATTADLADYTRLINAKVSNPQAQQKIDEWNQKNQQLQFLQRRLQDNFSEQLSRQMRELESQVFADADKISKEFPEAAELFETTRTDIKQLRDSIPAGTVVVQPILLTNVKNVPNTVAIFIITKDQLSVIKNAIDAKEFDKLLTEYRQQLQNDGDTRYTETGSKIYDILIRPVEDKIQAFSPKQLSIIATGKLRYIPFETLYDKQTRQYLIEKYPINYLTRLSPRSLLVTRNFPLLKNIATLPGIAAIIIISSIAIWMWRKFGIVPTGVLIIILGGGTYYFIVQPNAHVLALGNPIPRDPQNLPGTEEEVRNIAQLFPGSESFLHDNATLDKFKTFAPRFPFLHLATHGCFQPEGCPKLGMKANTILFADKQLNIADAALLGLQNTELLTLSACQTALQANSNGEEIAGLAYIFERAGAKAVMASLWNAEDNTTKEIMIQFYQNIKNGMSKGEALQKAKLSQIERHPFYWSPFILIGDAR